MNDQDEIKLESDILFCSLNCLYGHLFDLEMQSKLRAGVATVAKTLVVLRSVPMNQVGDPSLPFTPFRKED
jgi:hypothetical protein